MALRPGQAAPSFELYSDSHRPVRLTDSLGRWVLLVFFPGAFTSVCTRELLHVDATFDHGPATDLQVYGLSTDSPFALAEFRAQLELRFALLSDHDAEVARAYGAKYEKDGAFPMGLHRVAKRAVFLIDPQGRIAYGQVLEDADEEPDFDAVRRVLLQ